MSEPAVAPLAEEELEEAGGRPLKETFLTREPFAFRLRIPASFPKLTSDQFFDLCAENHPLRIEREADGDLMFMSPSGGESSHQSVTLAAHLYNWALRDGTGVVFDSAAEFELPDGSAKAPDLSWLSKKRLGTIPVERRRKFIPLCPEFVVEVMSPSDRLKDAQEKMDGYLANGLQLGWLVDPKRRQVFVYRPGPAVDHLKNPARLAGDPVLPGFVADLAPVWQGLDF